MDIAFCINHLGLIGLGVTITSLIRNCSAIEKLHIHFLCAYLSERDKFEIKQLLTFLKFPGNFSFIDFDPATTFSSFKPLHGDWTPYGRLLLSDILKVPKVLYLDSDLVIDVDVLELDTFDFGGKAIAAVHGGFVRTEYEHDFYVNRLGLSPALASFNSGVLLLNLTLWREQHIRERCFELANRFPSELVTADQTILNGIFAGSFAKLPDKYNSTWSAHNEQQEVAGRVIHHFVGSPKPWDLFGFLIHKGYRIWKSYSNERWEMHFFKFSLSNLKRTWYLRRSYVRILKNNMKR
jgi:lipopolysaccharide biosynthesis glycosyltransferase